MSRKNSFMEALRGARGTREFHYGEFDALRAYELSYDMNLDYPLVVETVSDRVNIMLTTFLKAHIGKFYYACPSTSSTDEIATFYITGWRIADVIPTEVLLGEKSYKTCCKNVILFKRVK